MSLELQNLAIAPVDGAVVQPMEMSDKLSRTQGPQWCLRGSHVGSGDSQ